MQPAKNPAVLDRRVSGSQPRAPRIAGGRGGASIILRHQVKGTTKSVTYDGTPRSVRAARRFVRLMVDDLPRADDLELIAAELATNAIRHTPSGQPGGTFTITVRRSAGRVRLEVSDQGDGLWPTRPAMDGDVPEFGRGLSIVTTLADETGHCLISATANTIWAEIAILACLVSRPLDTRAVRTAQTPAMVKRDSSGRCRVRSSSRSH
jgi:anti-sigma regulatory factor (Ser/Thr protein kinase)